MERLVHKMVRLYARAIDLPAEYFDAAFQDPQYSLRMTHYPHQDGPVLDEFGLAPHTDTSFLTLLAPNDYIRMVLDFHLATFDVQFIWDGVTQQRVATLFASQHVPEVGLVYVALFGSTAGDISLTCPVAVTSALETSVSDTRSCSTSPKNIDSGTSKTASRSLPCASVKTDCAAWTT